MGRLLMTGICLQHRTLYSDPVSRIEVAMSNAGFRKTTLAKPADFEKHLSYLCISWHRGSHGSMCLSSLIQALGVGIGRETMVHTACTCTNMLKD